MSYSPITDFVALLRLSSGGSNLERMPGLDFVVAAMARAGLFSLYTGQTAPVVNQANTVWFLPSAPSWVAEGAVFLWNAAVSQYQPATPALWVSLLSSSGYAFQSVTTAFGSINSGTTIAAVQRVAPTATALVLPNLIAQFLTGRPLKIVDWSSAVTGHTITLTTPDGATIMKQAAWQLLSGTDQLSSIALHPSPDLNGWVIAP